MPNPSGATLLLCFAALFAVSAASSLRYNPTDVAALKAQAVKLRAEILEEKRRDQSLLQERKDDAKYAESEEALAVSAYAKAKSTRQASLHAHQAEHAKFNAIKLEYATNRLVRDKETKTINSISDEIANLVKIGKGTIGDMGAGANSLLQTGLNNMLELEKSKKMAHNSADTLLQATDSIRDVASEIHRMIAKTATKRATPKSKEMLANLNTLLAKLKLEERADNSRVKAQDAAASAKSTKLAEDSAAEETRLELQTQATATRLAADAALAEQSKTFNDANLVRDKELDKLTQFEQELANLVAVRTADEATALIQAHAGSEVYTRMLTMLNSIKTTVQFEEKVQLQVKLKYEADASQLSKESTAAETEYRAQLGTSKELLTKLNLANGEMESAEGQLAAERATALQETRMINQLRATITQFSKNSVTVLGDCPEHHGLVCSGQGTCDTTKFTCKCALGRTGKACQFCSYGYKMLNGICLRGSFVDGMNSVELQRTATENAEDSSLVLLQLQTGMHTARAHAEMSTIEAMLTNLERKLRDTQKQLVDARDNKVEHHRVTKAAYDASVAMHIAKRKTYLAALNKYRKASKLMRLVRAMYDYEHPLRVKEIASIDIMIGLVNQLAGFSTAPTAPAAPATLAIKPTPVPASLLLSA